MGTHNGAPHLGAQLQSFVDQTHDAWTLWVSDDGSADTTRDQIDRFGAAHPGRLGALQDGPGQGIAGNFLSLLMREELAGCWVAFSDQDDVWLPHKLARAVERLSALPDQRGIYASRTIHTDESLTPLGESKIHQRPFGFGNALVQNVLAGNTIVMPPETTDLVRRSASAALSAGVPFHDWWVYLVCAGADVPVVYDREPSMYYRQHRTNALGAASARRLDRFAKLRSRVYARWFSNNLAALDQTRALLTPAAEGLLDRVTEWRNRPRLWRRSPRQLGLYRQTAGGDEVLRLMARAGWL
ncbi:glycosyltransferase [Thalassorhabdomicrobium marinisediminis]|uniref:glycosyltransferase n=1 Tax=Thalassorhabdomicrobium marinisediminis TaxID=2170577 RepID=UPI00249214DC|nr:glycosyltransferase [Thalassorhabdomicrobium marinisediminis]